MTSRPEFDSREAMLTRQFDLADGGAVYAHIWKPVYYPDVPEEGTYEYYKCHFQITGLGSERISYADGVDSVQALMLALKVMSTILYNSTAYETGDLTYLGGRDLDLTVSDGMRADRQGYEKADLLCMPGYTTVVQLPDDRFASVVFGGEYLHSLVSGLTEISESLKGANAEACEKLEVTTRYLAGTLKYFEGASKQAGLHLPYVSKSDS